MYWVACGRCFTTLPRAVRRELWGAWRNRVLDPLSYQEALIGALLIKGGTGNARVRMGKDPHNDLAA